MPRPARRRRVAVLFKDHASLRLLDGVLSVARSAGWVLSDDAAGADAVVADSPRPAGDGRPWVHVAAFADADVRPDPAGVGRLAADHFLSRGFVRFARSAGPWAAAFDAAAAAAGRPTPVDAAAVDPSDPTPLAVLAIDDADARRHVARLTGVGRQVPGGAAVLGVGDDRALCELTDVPIASIDLSYERLGRSAGDRVRRLLRGNAPNGPTLVRPAGIVSRRSTDTVAVADEDVAAALTFIREHACGPLRTGDVMRAVGLDRRTLERRFAKALGRSPMEAARRFRAERAAEMLRTTGLPVADIAAACGYRLPQHLSAAFRRQFGQSPGDFPPHVISFPLPVSPGEGTGARKKAARWRILPCGLAEEEAWSAFAEDCFASPVGDTSDTSNVVP